MDQDIGNIWEECRAELDTIYKMGTDYQSLLEQTIGNVAALKMLGDDGVEEAVKNS